MTLEEALFAHLAAIGSNTEPIANTRVYPLLIPLETIRPAIAYQRIAGPRINLHDGPSGLARATIQITCQAPDYSIVKRLINAVRKDLDGYKGLMGGVSGTDVQWCNMISEIDGDELQDAAIVRADFQFLYRE